MSWKGRNVLVTGGASFIGSHLASALLERGAAVRVVDNLSTGIEENLGEDRARIDFTHADLLAPGVAEKATQDIDVVFHLAADHGGRGYIELHQAACAGNMRLDTTVFQAAAAAGAQKIVFASSACVYPPALQADLTREVYLEEADVGPPYEADGMYGWAKLMAEFTLKTYAKELGIDTVSCRYFTVFGERCKESHAIMAMIGRAFIKQDPFVVWGNGEQIRNWTYVGDIVEGTIRSAEKISDGRAINLGTSERTKVIDAVKLVLEMTGHEAEIELHPEMPTGPLNRAANNELAKELLRWEPEVRFRDGLKRAIEWYYANHDFEETRDHLESMLTERVASKKDASAS